MDTYGAFMRAEMNKGRPHKVFDWEKAARLIVEHKPAAASAGLSSDWEWTGGTIWRDGKPVPKDKTYTYLSSNWATPEIDLDGRVLPCWRWMNETPGWDSETYWPAEALAIVG